MSYSRLYKISLASCGLCFKIVDIRMILEILDTKSSTNHKRIFVQKHPWYEIAIIIRRGKHIWHPFKFSSELFACYNVVIYYSLTRRDRKRYNRWIIEFIFFRLRLARLRLRFFKSAHQGIGCLILAFVCFLFSSPVVRRSALLRALSLLRFTVIDWALLLTS